MADAGGGTDAAAKGDAVEKFQHDDVARLSSAVLRPHPDAASKHTWLSELGTSVAARVRDCLHCGSGSAVRKEPLTLNLNDTAPQAPRAAKASLLGLWRFCLYDTPSSKIIR